MADSARQCPVASQAHRQPADPHDPSQLRGDRRVLVGPTGAFPVHQRDPASRGRLVIAKPGVDKVDFDAKTPANPPPWFAGVFRA